MRSTPTALLLIVTAAVAVPPACCGARLGAGSAPSTGELLFSARREGLRDLWLRRGEAVERLGTGAAPANGGKWSPDGSRIAFQSQRDGNYEIYLLSMDGGDARNLTLHPEFDGLPVWSPDGAQLAFFSRRHIDATAPGQFPGHIYLMGVDDASEPTRLTEQPLETTFGPSDWSPDGETLLLSRLVSGQADIYLLRVADGTETRLTSLPESEAGAVFSPDGRRIAFYAESGDRSDIVVMSREGHDRRTLTTSPGQHYYPAWSPDGKWITFTTLHPSGDTDIRAVEVATGKEIDLVATAEDERESSWRPIVGDPGGRAE